MPAPDNIRQLVQRFEEHRDAYRSGHYNETQLRREFLDPFFEALGWDIFNKQGYAEPYKDVISLHSLLNNFLLAQSTSPTPPITRGTRRWCPW
jgi:hypothetical protein